jgi:hypothetical protein
VENEQSNIPDVWGLIETLGSVHDPVTPPILKGVVTATDPEKPLVLVAVSWKLPPLPAVTLLKEEGFALSV